MSNSWTNRSLELNLFSGPVHKLAEQWLLIGLNLSERFSSQNWFVNQNIPSRSRELNAKFALINYFFRRSLGPLWGPEYFWLSRCVIWITSRTSLHWSAMLGLSFDPYVLWPTVCPIRVNNSPNQWTNYCDARIVVRRKQMSVLHLRESIWRKVQVWLMWPTNKQAY